MANIPPSSLAEPVTTTCSKLPFCESLRILANDVANRQTASTDNDDNTQISLLVLTWNMAGKLPDQDTLVMLLCPTRVLNDLIVIGTQ